MGFPAGLKAIMLHVHGKQANFLLYEGREGRVTRSLLVRSVLETRRAAATFRLKNRPIPPNHLLSLST